MKEVGTDFSWPSSVSGRTLGNNANIVALLNLVADLHEEHAQAIAVKSIMNSHNKKAGATLDALNSICFDGCLPGPGSGVSLRSTH